VGRRGILLVGQFEGRLLGPGLTYLDCAAHFRICRFWHSWRRFPLAFVFQWFRSTLQKRRHACKSHRMRKRGGAVQIGALNPR